MIRYVILYVLNMFFGNVICVFLLVMICRKCSFGCCYSCLKFLMWVMCLSFGGIMMCWFVCVDVVLSWLLSGLLIVLCVRLSMVWYGEKFVMLYGIRCELMNLLLSCLLILRIFGLLCVIIMLVWKLY